jgi:hypothetical protein
MTIFMRTEKKVQMKVRVMISQEGVVEDLLVVGQPTQLVTGFSAASVKDRLKVSTSGQATIDQHIEDRRGQQTAQAKSMAPLTLVHALPQAALPGPKRVVIAVPDREVMSMTCACGAPRPW